MFADDQDLLREDLRTWLAHVQARYAWGADAAILLSVPGKLLSGGSSPSIRIPVGFWALLPVLIASYCSSQASAQRIRRLGLACELLLCSLDYFDEIEDDDSSDVRRTLGDGRLLNCASALLVEGLQVLAEIDPIGRLASIASEELRHAMSGQHQDLLAEQRPLDGFDPDECVAIASAKAGSLCRMVCRLATAMVGASDEISALFAQIGTHIGISAQIENDMHDLEQELSADATSAHKNDLRSQKKTFPLVLLAQLSLEQLAEGRELSLQQPTYRNVLQQALGGAIVHRLAAASLVESIEQLRDAPFPPKLRLILGIDIDAY